MTTALIIAASPLAKRSDGTPLGQLGSVLAHACHLVRHGGVFWDIFPPSQWVSKEFPHSEVRTVYFYDVPSQSVVFRGDVEFAGTLNEVPSWDKYQWYLPSFRELSEHAYLILITSMGRLDRNYKLGDFRKLSDGSAVERVQNYVLIEDPDYSTIIDVP